MSYKSFCRPAQKILFLLLIVVVAVPIVIIVNNIARESDEISVEVRAISRLDDPLSSRVDGVEGRHVCFMRETSLTWTETERDTHYNQIIYIVGRS